MATSCPKRKKAGLLRILLLDEEGVRFPEVLFAFVSRTTVGRRLAHAVLLPDQAGSRSVSSDLALREPARSRRFPIARCRADGRDSGARRSYLPRMGALRSERDPAS